MPEEINTSIEDRLAQVKQQVEDLRQEQERARGEDIRAVEQRIERKMEENVRDLAGVRDTLAAMAADVAAATDMAEQSARLLKNLHAEREFQIERPNADSIRMGNRFSDEDPTICAADVDPGELRAIPRQDHVHGLPFSDADPQPIGTADPGTGEQISRQDHVHPFEWPDPDDEYQPPKPPDYPAPTDPAYPGAPSIKVNTPESGSGTSRMYDFPPGTPPAVLCLQSSPNPHMEWVTVPTKYQGVYSDGSNMVADWVRAHA